jgi:hypothetical protein
MLEHDPIQDREQFSDLMKAAFGSASLDPRRMSNDLGFSASTVYRWVDGKSAPHPSLWPLVQGWLMQSLAKEVKGLEALNASGDSIMN